MSECIDGFKIGCEACGFTPCCCGNAKKEVHDSKGACVAVQGDFFSIINGSCKAPEGGTKTVGAPLYALTVENPPDDIQRDENGAPILVDGKTVAKT